MYNFIDVNEASESVVLPSEALKINGAYIEDQISGYRTLHVSGREALSPDVVTYATGIRDGSKIKSKRYPERIITVTYQIAADTNEAFREAYNKLAQILNVEDAELIFNDEQDKFFVGTPCVISPVEPGRNSVVGEFEILCSDPFKYSVIEYEAQPDLHAGSVLIDYRGTYKSFPSLVAQFYKENEASADGSTAIPLTGSGDCGYVAFFNEHEKIIQIGDPEDAEGEEVYDKSQTLVNATFNSSNSWGSAAKNQWTANEYGSLHMGIASYAVSETPATTSDTILNVTSKAESPHVKYTVTAKASDRTANSVKVTLSITAALTSSSSYWYNSAVLINSVYIGGSWHEVTMKEASDRWKSTSGHTKNITVTVTGLAANATSLSGIKFKATRKDGLGKSGVLNETSCKNLAISQYVASSPETYYLSASSYGSGSAWHGPSITRTIPADASGKMGATNFTFTYSQKMSIGSGSKATDELGTFQVMLYSGTYPNGKIVAAVNIQKSQSGKKGRLRFYINGKQAKTVDVDLSYGNKYFNSSKTSTIKKSGQTVDFDICGIKHTFRESGITSVAVNQIIFTFSQHSTKTPLAHNGLYWAKFVKNNCDTWKNIPNKFSANDVVEAHCGKGEIYLNGLLSPALGALGNDWEDFYLAPGLNQIGFSYSGWVASSYAPKPIIRYREVFL